MTQQKTSEIQRIKDAIEKINNHIDDLNDERLSIKGKIKGVDIYKSRLESEILLDDMWDTSIAIKDRIIKRNHINSELERIDDNINQLDKKLEFINDKIEAAKKDRDDYQLNLAIVKLP